MCSMPGSAGYTTQEAPVGQEAGEASPRSGGWAETWAGEFIVVLWKGTGDSGETG